MSDDTKQPLRVICYVDGFNLYHGIKEHSKTRKFRWVNLWALTEAMLLPGHKLERVIYFTSLPPWNSGKQQRHERYISALSSVGVEIIRGRFQQDQALCRGECGQLYTHYVEKLTDVHIATTILRHGVKGKFDWAYLISGDADQAPTIRTLAAMVPSAKVRVLFPPRRHSTELDQLADSRDHMYPQAFKKYQFPDRIIVAGRTIEKPTNW